MANTRISAFARFSLALAVACLSSGAALGEELVVPGSGNMEFVLGELAKAFNTSQSTHHVVVPPSSGHAGAVRDVSEGVATLGRVGRPLTEPELAKGLTYIPLGRDAVVAVAGAAVTVRGITSEQLKGIFGGKITDWSQLGGQPAPIRAIGKEATDSIRRQLAAKIPDLNYAESVKIVHLDPYLIELIDRYPSSFAIMNRSALEACKSKVVILALDGVLPSIDNLVNGTYPLSAEYGLIHKAGRLSSASKAFVDFIRSPEGEKILRAHGVLAKRQ
ncbi:substrate-binding domain-containing protein [Dechloromonas denitrificans]|uniref:substrate-binding domain-containing protein n=1 Tax=Dechloromonas denitrificans TaxID=281362 RepID=UPI001CFB7BCB|nr:substrate-binding domain-containing protein [Dechloromonas denitrificans]UCV07313.1 substrate-binding domain-containing protein [Dechloromonas denitrificans]